MRAPRDKFGRPVVVVTGMGRRNLRSGAGKTDNWAKLTAGESGIRTLTRFPIEGLKTTMAGTIDFVPVEPFTSVGLSERLAHLAVEEAIAQAGIGTRATFPARFSSPCRRLRLNGRNAKSSGARWGFTDFSYEDLLKAAGGGKFVDLTIASS